MAFGKKQRDDETPATRVVPEAEEAAPESDLSGELFTTAEEPAEPAPEETPETPAETGADATGDLLNMFQTTQIEEQDRSVLKTLAGDVELDDLVEELQTVAAALGISIDREAFAA